MCLILLKAHGFGLTMNKDFPIIKMFYVMKFDLVISNENETIATHKSISFLVLVAVLISFPRKNYDRLSFFIIKLENNEN